MTSRKPVQLEFTDCTHCGKRIATTAKRCHHCQATFTTLSRPQPEVQNRELAVKQTEEVSDESHMSLSYGGYDDHEMEDKDEETTDTRGKFWRYVAWMLIIIFAIFAVLPLIF